MESCYPLAEFARLGLGIAVTGERSQTEACLQAGEMP